jgi:hypothetical protein
MIAPKRVLGWLLAPALVLSVTCGLAYGEAQQVLRSAANDPQEQLAGDAARALDAGAAPATLVAPGSAAASAAGPGPVDVATSLAPFLVVYDSSGSVLATNGELDGVAPVPPAGVLATARSSGRDAVTWQPVGGARIAAVAIGWSGGSVLAGRSLRLTEEREDRALAIAALAWLIGMAALVVAVLVADRLLAPPASGQAPPAA